MSATEPGRRVVVTGLGAVTPVGNDVKSTWDAILAGRSGVTHLSLFDTTRFPDAIGGEVKKDFQPEIVLSSKDVRVMDRNVQFACVAALEAVRDSALDTSSGLGDEAGVIFGSGAGGYTLMEEQARILGEKGPRRVSPWFLSNVLPDAASGYIAMLTGARGPNHAVISACATGAAAIGEAAEVIRRGDAEVMIAGGTEAPITPILFSAFFALRALAPSDGDPAGACKPFDARRVGFVVAEGSGAVVLESLEHARARGARIYGELSGYGSSNDAFDMIASEESGRGPILAINMALRKSKIDPRRIGYVNAHGTGTPMNDRVETVALKCVFGEHAQTLAISSTKSMLGHMMGAAGAVEAIFSLLALHDQVLPPTINYKQPDPDCDLDYVPNEARKVSGLEAVLSNSIGLGGHNASLVFQKLED